MLGITFNNGNNNFQLFQKIPRAVQKNAHKIYLIDLMRKRHRVMLTNS